MLINLNQNDRKLKNFLDDAFNLNIKISKVSEIKKELAALGQLFVEKNIKDLVLIKEYLDFPNSGFTTKPNLLKDAFCKEFLHKIGAICLKYNGIYNFYDNNKIELIKFLWNRNTPNKFTIVDSDGVESSHNVKFQDAKNYNMSDISKYINLIKSDTKLILKTTLPVDTLNKIKNEHLKQKEKLIFSSQEKVKLSGSVLSYTDDIARVTFNTISKRLHILGYTYNGIEFFINSEKEFNHVKENYSHQEGIVTILNIVSLYGDDVKKYFLEKENMETLNVTDEEIKEEFLKRFLSSL